MVCAIPLHQIGRKRNSNGLHCLSNMEHLCIRRNSLSYCMPELECLVVNSSIPSYSLA